MLYDLNNDPKQNIDISKLNHNQILVSKYQKKLRVMREKVRQNPFEYEK